MRTLSFGTCGLLLSFLTLGGCAMLDASLGGGSGEAPPAPPRIVAPQPAPPVPAPDDFTAADYEAIDDPDADVIRGVQAALNEAGFPVGTPDGRIGKRTLHGMRLFKVAKRMPVTNTITPALLTALAVPRAQ